MTPPAKKADILQCDQALYEIGLLDDKGGFHFEPIESLTQEQINHINGECRDAGTFYINKDGKSVGFIDVGPGASFREGFLQRGELNFTIDKSSKVTGPSRHDVLASFGTSFATFSGAMFLEFAGDMPLLESAGALVAAHGISGILGGVGLAAIFGIGLGMAIEGFSNGKSSTWLADCLMAVDNEFASFSRQVTGDKYNPNAHLGYALLTYYSETVRVFRESAAVVFPTAQ